METLFTVRGKVKKGARRGESLGFPTANIQLHKKIPAGIYAAEVGVGAKIYQAAVFVGSPKTFSAKDYNWRHTCWISKARRLKY